MMPPGRAAAPGGVAIIGLQATKGFRLYPSPRARCNQRRGTRRGESGTQRTPANDDSAGTKQQRAPASGAGSGGHRGVGCPSHWSGPGTPGPAPRPQIRPPRPQIWRRGRPVGHPDEGEEDRDNGDRRPTEDRDGRRPGSGRPMEDRRPAEGRGNPRETRRRRPRPGSGGSPRDSAGEGGGEGGRGKGEEEGRRREGRGREGRCRRPEQRRRPTRHGGRGSRGGESEGARGRGSEEEETKRFSGTES